MNTRTFETPRPTPLGLARVGGFAALCLLAACAPTAPVVQAPAEGRGPVAVAQLLDAQGQPAGRASFTPAGSGVEIVVEAQGLAPGPHGVHVHTQGECAPGVDPATGQTVAFGAAGPHFDPGGAGAHRGPGAAAHHGHAGDAPNIEVAADGRGTLRHMTGHLSVAAGAPNSVFGRSIVVHEKPDDYRSDPAGASGARLLCGAIMPMQARPPMG